MISTSTATVGVTGLLGALFVALKLTGYIQWSWWLVTLPFWGFWALLLLVILLFSLGVLAVEALQNRRGLLK